MTDTNQVTVEQRARELQDYIATGRIIEAMQEFYAEDVVMRDNLELPCEGRAANIEREQAWLGSVREFTGFEVLGLAVSGDTCFVESSMDFVTTDGQAVHMEQVSRSRWKEGRIVNEQFYHG